MTRCLHALLVVTLLATNAEARPARWEPQKTYALLVGIVKWQRGQLVDFATDGRRDQVLVDTLLADGVPRDQLVFLEDAAATTDAIRRELTGLLDRAGPGSTFLFYFEGHGLQQRAKYFLGSYDVDKDQPSATGFAVDELSEIVGARFHGDQILLFADCCHSGALAEVVERESQRGRRAACLTSATDSNISTGRWTFTDSLIAAFAGDGAADGDRDRRLSFAEVDDFIHREMRFREDQLTRGVRSATFPADFLLRDVPAKKIVPPPQRVAGPFAVGDFVDAWSEKPKPAYYRGQVVGFTDGQYRVHFLRWSSKWDESMGADKVRAIPINSWSVGARVEANWKGKWYPGTITRAEEGYFYFVHYDHETGEWDEWVTDARLRPPTVNAPKPMGIESPY